LSINLLKSLSIFANFLASKGICLAMSPPVNTLSRLVHRSCTFSHSSSVSLVSDNRDSVDCASFLNGATCRMESIVCSDNCDSSNDSMISPYLSRIGTSRPLHVLKLNSVTDHSSLMSVNFVSI